MAVADAMLPHVAGRAATRKRWPNGVDDQAFFEKNLAAHAPKWLDRRTLRHKQRTVTYPLFDSAASLAWLGQQAALELHVPQWRFAGNAQGAATASCSISTPPGRVWDCPTARTWRGWCATRLPSWDGRHIR